MRSGPRLTVYDSVYQTALNNGIEPEMVDEMIKIMSFDVDFNAKVQPGDSLQIFHSVPETGEKAEIMFVEIQLNGVTKRYYRYRTQDDGIVDFYNDSVEAPRNSSCASRSREQNSVRLSAGVVTRFSRSCACIRVSTGRRPRGTPILAAGNGRISRGNGPALRQLHPDQHTNGYATGYGHMSGFQSGLKVGDYVHQGQVIGFVGSTAFPPDHIATSR